MSTTIDIMSADRLVGFWFSAQRNHSLVKCNCRFIHNLLVLASIGSGIQVSQSSFWFVRFSTYASLLANSSAKSVGPSSVSADATHRTVSCRDRMYCLTGSVIVSSKTPLPSKCRIVLMAATYPVRMSLVLTPGCKSRFSSTSFKDFTR